MMADIHHDVERSRLRVRNSVEVFTVCINPALMYVSIIQYRPFEYAYLSLHIPLS